MVIRDIDDRIIKTGKTHDIRLLLLLFFIHFYQPSRKKVKVSGDGGDILPCPAFIVDVFNAGFQKIIPVIMEKQMILIEPGFSEQIPGLPPEKSDPA